MQQSGHLPGTYISYRPNISHHSETNRSKLETFPTPKASVKDCHNWCAQYDEKPEKVEIIDPKSGYAIKNGQRQASRLSKTAIFTIYKRVLEQRRLGAEATDLDYKTAKEHSKNYQKVWTFVQNLVPKIIFLNGDIHTPLPV